MNDEDINVRDACPYCEGFGLEPGSDEKHCHRCYGYGTVCDAVAETIRRLHESCRYDHPLFQMIANYQFKMRVKKDVGS